MTFKEWLATRRITDSARGDFISDVLKDDRFPDGGYAEGIECYLIRHHACPEAIKEFKKLWRQYEKEC